MATIFVKYPEVDNETQLDKNIFDGLDEAAARESAQQAQGQPDSAESQAKQAGVEVPNHSSAISINLSYIQL